VYDKKSWEMMEKIMEYFGVAATKVPTDDWDAVEEIIKKVIKSSRAGTNMQDGAKMEM
jgi:ATP-dependent RNA helicase DDX19/DBP5